MVAEVNTVRHTTKPGLHSVCKRSRMTCSSTNVCSDAFVEVDKRW